MRNRSLLAVMELGVLAAAAFGPPMRGLDLADHALPGRRTFHASTIFGGVSGDWRVASLWSNGVPTSTLSAIVSSTGGIPVLPVLTSAITKNLTGGGTIGISHQGVNKLTIVSPSANTVLQFVGVDMVEQDTIAGTGTPRGHG